MNSFNKINIRKLLAMLCIVVICISGISVSVPVFAQTENKTKESNFTNLIVFARFLDEDEFIDVISMPIDEAYKKIMNNEIHDSKTIIAIMKAYNDKYIK